MAKTLPPLHPGEVLREEFLAALKLSPGALAKATGVPRTRIERIAAETTGITADIALRLGKALNTSAQLWLNLQNAYDLAVHARNRKADREDRADSGAGSGTRGLIIALAALADAHDTSGDA